VCSNSCTSSSDQEKGNCASNFKHFVSIFDARVNLIVACSTLSILSNTTVAHIGAISANEAQGSRIRKVSRQEKVGNKATRAR
jgi:hypothetical protein